MLTVGSEFSGIGLLDYGLHLAGLHHAWLCERDPWRRDILRKRFPGARVLDDVRHIGAGTVEPVTVLAGGFPCKGASSAGPRNGFGHPETVLWREMARAVRELRPRYVLVENVANILALHGGAVWGEVVGDLAALGYDVVWDCLPAGAVGAPHLRDRVFAVAAHPGSARACDSSPEPNGRRGARPAALQREWNASLRRTGGCDPSAADADGADELWRPGFRGVADGRSDARGGRETSTDASRDAEGGAAPPARPERERARTRAVEWGEYAPAIRRWEAVHGPAPAPLVERVRGVDARSAARVERSRLSALGDGVQVQVGRIAGAYIIELERRLLADAA